MTRIESGDPERSHAMDSESALIATGQRLTRWLVDDAYPRWWLQGADRLNGGFHERLYQNGEPLNEPRRARLHPRQIYAFSLADDLGHDGLTEPAVRHGLDFFLRHYVREDRFIRAQVAPDGSVVDDSVVLYDQAFALLGYAAAFDVLNDESFRARAHDLLANVRRHMTNAAGGFKESPQGTALLTSNSHMHMLEAALAWMALDHDECWKTLARHIVELAIASFADPQTGQVREFFNFDWSAAPGIAGSLVEPGHQFEWAWLLLRWYESSHDPQAAAMAQSLIEIAEKRGVDASRDVAVNALLIDGSVHDSSARLWPQAERLKAACIAWETMRLPSYRDSAQRAAASLERYFNTPVRGLWYDRLDPAGRCIDEPAPASSFYHIVAAIAELNGMIHRAAAAARLQRR
jgi:mannose/cellobiose epimerase-like protein (N-acyl-D-glucosamine 2-epimerase family)